MLPEREGAGVRVLDEEGATLGQLSCRKWQVPSEMYNWGISWKVVPSML